MLFCPKLTSRQLAAAYCLLQAVLLGCNGKPALPTAGTEAPIVVTEPRPGAQLRVGDTVRIRWTCDTLEISDVNIVLSVDGGVNWLLLNHESSVTISNPAWGDFAWVVPEAYSYPDWLPDPPPAVPLPGKTARIKVYKYEYPEVCGISGELMVVSNVQEQNQ